MGGNVAGLTGTGLVLRNNGGDNRSIATNGAFTFATPVVSGGAYAATVFTQPSSPTQTCTVTNGSGTVTAAITTIVVNCVTNTYTVGGTVSGLATGGTVVLQNNTGNNLTVSANGSFAFSTALNSGATYAVTKLAGSDPTLPAGSPAGQICSVTSGTGTVSTANITSVAVTCVNNDVTAPTVTAKTPLSTTVGTSLSTTITATFSEAIDTSSITASNLTVKGGNLAQPTAMTTVAGTFSFSAGNTKVTFTPTSALAFNTDYAITATTGVKDASGRALASAVSWNFNTGKRITTGGGHACARFADGRVKCWGDNAYGQLGIDNTVNHGDGTGLMGDGTGANGSGMKPVTIPNALGGGHTIVSVAAGDDHTCAIIENGRVFCWGRNAQGELGMGFTSPSVGHSVNDMSLNALPVNLGGRTATQISLGNEMSCALLDDGSVKCWGDGDRGATGQGNTSDSNVALPVSLGTGRTAIEISAGGTRACAILDNNALKCWGDNRWGQAGVGAGEQIAGAANTNHIGDASGEMGDSMVAVNLGSVTPLHIAVADGHLCVLTTAGAVRCLGNNTWGQAGSNVGNGSPLTQDDCNPAKNTCIGDNATELGNNLPQPIAPGGAVEVTVGYRQACARTVTNAIKCWGTNEFGQIGLGTNAFPLDDVGDGAGEIATLGSAIMKPGKTVVELSGGGFYECVTNTDATSQCWGRSSHGVIGHGDTFDIGEDSFDMGAGLVDLDLGI